MKEINKEMLHLVAGYLQHRSNEGYYTTNSQIQEMILINTTRVVRDADVRHIIHEIRVKDLLPCLIANCNGYKVIPQEEVLLKYEESLLSKENSIRAVRRAMRRQRENLQPRML